MKRQPFQAVRHVLQYRLFFVMNGILFVLIALSFGREFVRSASIQREIAALQDEKQSLEERNQSLEDYQEYLSTESFLEKEAREKFGLQRPGETQVFIEGELLGGSIETKHEDISLQDTARLQQWVWYFFDPEQYDRKEAS